MGSIEAPRAYRRLRRRCSRPSNSVPMGNTPPNTNHMNTTCTSGCPSLGRGSGTRAGGTFGVNMSRVLQKDRVVKEGAREHKGGCRQIRLSHVRWGQTTGSKAGDVAEPGLCYGGRRITKADGDNVRVSHVNSGVRWGQTTGPNPIAAPNTREPKWTSCQRVCQSGGQSGATLRPNPISHIAIVDHTPWLSTGLPGNGKQ